MFEMITVLFLLNNKRLCPAKWEDLCLQGRTQATGNILTLFNAVPFDSAVFLTWWELGASHGRPHKMPELLSSAVCHLNSATGPR